MTSGQELWDYLEDNKAEIIAGRMVVDCFEYDDIVGAISECDEDHVLKVIKHLNEKTNPEHGVTWAGISDVDDMIRLEAEDDR